MAGMPDTTWRSRGLAVGLVVLAAAVAACSRAREESRSSDLGPAATVASGPRTAVGPRPLVPDVLPPPRPLRVGDALAGQPAAAHVPVSPAGASAGRPTDPVEVAGTPGPAVAEIRGMMRSYLEAFNRHDAAALVAHWSGSAENLDLDSGTVTSGRESVRQVFTALFEEDPSASIDIDVRSVRPIKPDVAVVDGVSRIAFSRGGPAASRFSAVVVREDGRWMLESVREASHPEAAEPRPLEDLGWLVGSWEDVGEGVTASTQCFWSAGRGFLVRSHRVLPDATAAAPPAVGDDRIPGLLATTDARPRELTEIIGWDPQRRGVRSWIFTSEGRFAEADWRRDGDHWTLEVAGRGADEGVTGVCTLTAESADRLSFQGGGGDPLAALLPPACGFTRTAR